MKKIIFSLLLSVAFNASAIEITNCNKKEINKNNNYFCLIKDEDQYYIKQSIDVKSNKNLKIQHERIQKIKHIPSKLFETDFFMENQNGLITIITKDKNLYTTRSGYIQKNGHYLNIENNELDGFKKEEISNVKKVVSNYNMYALDYHNQLWKKQDNIWNKIDLDIVYDFIYLENGFLYILTNKGLYKDIPERDNVSEGGILSSLPTHGIKLMPLKIDEELYKNKVTKVEYKKHIFEKLFSKNSLLDYSVDRDTAEITLFFKNIKNYQNDYDIYIDYDKVSVMSKDKYGFDKFSFHYSDSVNNKQLGEYYFSEELIAIKDKLTYSSKYDTTFPTVSKNMIETKYNGNVLFNKKEKIIIQKTYNSPPAVYENRSVILNYLYDYKNTQNYFSLRDNGKLTIIDLKNNKEHTIFNVNNIVEEYNGVFIIIDKAFSSQYYTNHEKLPTINAEKNTDENKFKFKFNGFDKINKLLIKEHLERK